MQQYLSNMLERTHDVITNVINRVFHMRPNLLAQIRIMHENIERQLKAECQRELELILEMEESFVYADNPLYKDTLKRTKKLHKPTSNESITVMQSARLPYLTTNASTNSITRSLKRTNAALSEDNDDDDDDNDIRPAVKISRTNGTSTNRKSTCE